MDNTDFLLEEKLFEQVKREVCYYEKAKPNSYHNGSNGHNFYDCCFTSCLFE